MPPQLNPALASASIKPSKEKDAKKNHVLTIVAKNKQYRLVDIQADEADVREMKDFLSLYRAMYDIF